MVGIYKHWVRSQPGIRKGMELTMVGNVKVEVEVDDAARWVIREVSVDVTVVVSVVVDLAGDEAREPDIDDGGITMLVGSVVVLTRRELPAPALVGVDEGDTGRIDPPIDDEVRGISFFFLNREEAGRTTGPRARVNVASFSEPAPAEVEAVGTTTSPKGSMNVAPIETVGLTLLDATLDAGVLAVGASNFAGAAAALEEPPVEGMLRVTPAWEQRPWATWMVVA